MSDAVVGAVPSAVRTKSAIWPLPVAFVVGTAAITWTVITSLRLCEGHLVYALDDAYIHMALARNLALHSAWSVDAIHFAPASSSPLWTLLLAALFNVVGISQLTSLMLNIVASALLLGIVYRIAAPRLSSAATALVLISIVLLAPLPTLVMEGMEHVLQAAIDLAFAACVVNMVVQQDDRRWSRALMFALAPLVTAVRYEGMFLVLACAAVLSLRGRWRDAMIVGLLGILPIGLMAAYSLANGGFAFPNSVLVKSQGQGLPDSLSIRAALKSVKRVSFGLSGAPHLLVLMLVSALLMSMRIRRGEIWTPAVIWNAVFLMTGLLHLQFAAIGWFYRYEAYLVVLGLVAVGTSTAGSRQAIPSQVPANHLFLAAAALSVCFFLQPLFWRAYVAITDTPKASANIYQQQVQMARFVDRFYPFRRIALNDIGAVAFLSRAQVLDLVGLADMRVARAKLQKVYGAEFVARLATDDQVPIAIVYETWFPNELPAHWQRVGQWSIENPIVSSKTVSFFATSVENAAELQDRLQQFSSSLPRQVAQSGLYVSSR